MSWYKPKVERWDYICTGIINVPGILEQVERERDNFVQLPYFANDETNVQRGQVIEFEVGLSV